MIDIRGNFFYTRTVPCQLWFFDRAKERDPERAGCILMLDARNIHRKVSRAVYDFSPEQQKNIAAIVWLYRGQSDRFLDLVESYLARSIAEGGAVAEPLAAFGGAPRQADRSGRTVRDRAARPGPLAEPWEELISARTTASADCAAFTAEVDAARRRLERRWQPRDGRTTPPSTRRGKACMTWRSAAGT